ncbi:SDR family NAD(P)-dependent oxidoreductase [Microbispora sitophila]|uniref:SDR family NAD(P)-dependent oxidoreductase n=1 Tax=Microbispora sitophila TaxID=2771537 RepID=UPI00299F647E|nr:SDR family oxidoreductase [Microbispora sitophila]
MRKTAVVTGGASGIGRAVAAELVRRGVHVTIADVRGAEDTAKDLGCAGVVCDVSDAEAVRELVTGVAAEHGRLDFLFNNAGIAVGGRAEEFTLDHWNRTIDVNLRGVVHGVHAAYPLMIEQGYGHIVNTASLAGLTPAPMMLPYTATKHAVVGLSLALRAEAAAHGVKVSVVCPGFTDTPLLDNANPGLPQTEIGLRARTTAVRAQGRLYPVESLARDVLRGVARNQALIVAPASARATWRAVRLSPALAVRAAGSAFRRIMG